MLEIIIGIYAGICWLLIKKLKLIPWTFPVQIVVYSLPIFASIAMILSLNYYCPITSDVRVANRSVDIASQITGKVKKVYVETNQEVKKGDTLFVLDRTPFLQEIKSLEAKIESTLATVNSFDRDLAASKSQIASIQSQLDLANKRVKQFQELVEAGAANRFDLDQAITTAQNLQAQMATAQAQMQSLQIKSSVEYNGENASVSELRAKLEQARWNLEQTVVLAPADGFIPSVQLNEGALLLPMRSAFVLIQKEQSVVGLFAQNELQAVKPGDEVEIALRSQPGKIIKARLEYVIDATSQGILNNAGILTSTAGVPNTAKATAPDAKLAAKFILEPNQPELTVGARGDATIYSDNINMLHMLRKVMIRISSKLNYIIPKLH